MSNIVKGLMGVSLSSLIRGARFGLQEFRAVSVGTTQKIQPLESAALRRLPVKTLEEIVDDQKVSITLPIQKFEDGMLPLDDAVALLTILVMARPAVVLEIGTYMGYTSRSMALNLPEATVHTLDLPLEFTAESDQVRDLEKDDFHLIQKRSPGREFVNTPLHQRIHQHFGDSARWDYQQAAGANFFFIDGSHTYDYCKVDSEKCHELCPHGIFLWHDCDDEHPGVVRALVEWRDLGRPVVRIAGTRLGFMDARSIGT